MRKFYTAFFDAILYNRSCGNYKFLIKYTETTEKNGQISQKNQVRYVFINAIDGSMTE